MLLVHQIRLPLNNATEQQAITTALRRANAKQADVAAAYIHKVSVDARRALPTFVYSVALQLHTAAQEKAVATAAANPARVRLVTEELPRWQPGGEALPGRMVVCGLGPAGLFCALALAKAGYAPLVLERGPAMDERRAAVDAFEAGGPLRTDANIQFGEGGAGTFSDGKLTTRIGDPLCRLVTTWLLEAGAPAEIATLAKPHIGTDLLRDVFVSLRKQLVAAGGEVRFNTCVTGFVVQKGRLAALQTNAGEVPCGALVLAVGHSARDTFTALHGAGALLAPKNFSVGFRAEHLQKDIDAGLYHAAAGHPALPPGEYQLSAKINGTGVYTFCMCPGGSVVAAASEEGGTLTNGMSLHARGGENANAAVVAEVQAAALGPSPFAGMAFQRELEQAAFRAGGGNYAAPAERLGSFLEGRGQLTRGRVQPTYPRGVVAASLGALLPPPVTEALQSGLRLFGKRLPGYAAPDALLTGLETRTSSPVRIERGAALESESLPGLWPAGEGAGYAGGIMSAATDGLRVAQAIVARYAPLG